MRPSRRVLFFDDYPSKNRTFLLILEQMVARLEGEVTEEKSVHKVEELLRTQRFDVIILDIMASRHGGSDRRAGLDILRECRSGRFGRLNQRAVIVMRTARGDLHKEALALGATHYFDKGSDDATDVVATIESALLSITR